MHEIVQEAVAIEKEFLTDALPCALIGINADVCPSLVVLLTSVHVPVHGVCCRSPGRCSRI